MNNRKQEAIDVLRSNWRDGYTIPSPYLYPFQWLWDSGFIALGYAHFDEAKAWSEIDHLFKGQWSNGLMPHIIFHKESDDYFPGPDIWKAHTFDHARTSPKTSGIIQPPVIGFILEELYHASEDKKGAEERIREWLPKLHRFHRHLHEERDPRREGLIYIRHNWESGLDNSPLWDKALERIEVSEQDLSSIRRDLKHIKADNRPSNLEYQKYIWLVELFVECEYDEAKIRKRCPFLIQDPVTNALLIKANESLYRLSVMLDEPVEDFKQWAENGKAAMNTRLWDEDTSNYLGYDLCSDELIHAPGNASFMAALYAGIPSEEQCRRIVARNLSSFNTHRYYLMPTVSPEEPAFEPRRYWRGPIWINTNWMLYRGLQHYGFDDWASRVKTDTLRLIEKYGIYEYFNPVKTETEGCGTSRFSWSAALYLDLLNSPR